MANVGPLPQAELLAIYRRLMAAARALEARDRRRDRRRLGRADRSARGPSGPRSPRRGRGRARRCGGRRSGAVHRRSASGEPSDGWRRTSSMAARCACTAARSIGIGVRDPAGPAAARSSTSDSTTWATILSRSRPPPRGPLRSSAGAAATTRSKTAQAASTRPARRFGVGLRDRPSGRARSRRSGRRTPCRRRRPPVRRPRGRAAAGGSNATPASRATTA